tara:strand:- start:329 stop:883 length:555 start_codon:yes stop_codon:yes gene_type:complete
MATPVANSVKSPLVINNQVPTERQLTNRVTSVGSYLKSSVNTNVVSSIIDIPLATGALNFNTGITIPAGSLLKSVGVFFTEECTSTGNGILSVAFGSTSGDTSIVAATALNASAEGITINSFVSTSNGAKGTSSGAAIAMAAGSALYFDSATTLFFQSTVATDPLSADCEVKVVVEYLEGVSNS